MVVKIYNILQLNVVNIEIYRFMFNINSYLMFWKQSLSHTNTSITLIGESRSWFCPGNTASRIILRPPIENHSEELFSNITSLPCYKDIREVHPSDLTGASQNIRPPTWLQTKTFHCDGPQWTVNSYCRRFQSTKTRVQDSPRCSWPIQTQFAMPLS